MHAHVRAFRTTSILIAAVPACAIACFSVATARFQKVGAWQSSLLYASYTASAVVAFNPTTSREGGTTTLMLGMTLYTAYIVLFGCASLVWQVPLALTGAIVGGVGAGMLWKAQGVWFSRAAQNYANCSSSGDMPMTLDDSNSQFAGIFAFVLLVEETLFTVLATILIHVCGFSWTIVFALYAAVAVAATVRMCTRTPTQTTDPPEHAQNQNCCKATAALSLLVNDPKMKYMIGFNVAFGFAGAFLNSFVSGEVVPLALGDDSFVGVLVAIHNSVAAVAAIVFGQFLSPRYGKGVVLTLGAHAFGGVAFLFLIQPDLTKWNWPLLVLVYSLQGVGRATFEGELKAVFADFFSYEKEGAFANIILQNGIGSAFGYFISFRLKCDKESKYCIRYQDGSLHDILGFTLLVVGSSVVAIIGYWRASYLFNVGQANLTFGQSADETVLASRRFGVTYSTVLSNATKEREEIELRDIS
jgi:hypothetical protein